jgi:hypothetical protein
MNTCRLSKKSQDANSRGHKERNAHPAGARLLVMMVITLVAADKHCKEVMFINVNANA